MWVGICEEDGDCNGELSHSAEHADGEEDGELWHF